MPYRFNSYQKEGRVAFTDLRFSVSRLLSRQTRRRFLFILLVFACIAIWMGSPQLEGRSYEYLHRSTSSSLRQHLGIRRTNTHHDPRVWNGWEGINAIFALYVNHNPPLPQQTLTQTSAATRTHPPASTLPAPNPTSTILSAILHGPVALHPMVQITSAI